MDLAGEPLFLESIQCNYNAAAARNQVYVVGMCFLTSQFKHDCDIVLNFHIRILWIRLNSGRYWHAVPQAEVSRPPASSGALA